MRHTLFLSVVLAAASLPGCNWYVETVSCSNGTVLDENDECVAPPVPDGGVTVDTCAELCELVAEWDDAQITCLGNNLGLLGPPPASCLAVVDEASCNTCITDVGTADESCVSAAAICQ